MRHIPSTTPHYLAFFDQTTECSTDSSLDDFLAQCLTVLQPLTANYIWQRDALHLVPSTVHPQPWQAPSSSALSSQQACLWGSSCIGESVEDEWLITSLLRAVTSALPCTARCVLCGSLCCMDLCVSRMHVVYSHAYTHTLVRTLLRTPRMPTHTFNLHIRLLTHTGFGMMMVSLYSLKLRTAYQGGSIQIQQPIASGGMVVPCTSYHANQPSTQHSHSHLVWNKLW